MPKRKKIIVSKIGKVFTSTLLLSTLYSEASFPIESPLTTKIVPSNVAARLINVLSHFFPSLHCVLEKILAKHIKDNQQLLNVLIGVRSESLASSTLPSLRGKYKNVQLPLKDPRFLSKNSNSSILELPTFAHPPFERRSQSVNISSLQNEKLSPTLSIFYSPTKASSILLDWRQADFSSENLKGVKQNTPDIVDQNVNYKGLSSSHVGFFGKSHMTEFNSKEIICLLESSDPEDEEQLAPAFKSKIDSEIGLSLEQNLEDRSHLFLKNTDVAFLKETEIMETSLEPSSWAAALPANHKLLSASPGKSRPRKPPSQHGRSTSIITHTLGEEEAVEAIQRLSSHHGNIPPLSSISERFSQSKLKDNKLPTSHAKAIDKALQEQNIKLSEKSGVIVALQRVVKDQGLKVSEVSTFVNKLSQQVDKLIVSTYKTTLKQVEKHILQLVQPHHHILTDIDFNPGFEELAQAVLALWRAKVLTEYIEKGGHEGQQKPLPTPNDLSPFVNQVIKERFENGLNPELNPQLKQNARIIINPSVQNSPIYGSPSKFSTEQKKEILAQVFKLLVLDPSFSLPTFTNSRGNPDIDSDELKRQMGPYIILAVGQLYGQPSALDIQINVLEEYVKTHCLYGGLSTFSEQERKNIFKSVLKNPLFNLLTVINSGNSESIKPFIVDSVEKLYGSNRVEDLELEALQVGSTIFSNIATSTMTPLAVEEIVKKAEPWLIGRLFELLPGNSKEEKLDFLGNIASQDEVLEKIRSEIKNCSQEDNLIQLRRQEQEVSEKTFSRIMKTILDELGSQDFNGSPLKLAIAVYRDVKFRIEDYLNTSSGFVSAIERTEPTLRQSLQEATTSPAIYQLVKDIARRGRYKIQMRIDSKRHAETSPLEVPKFVLLFSFPYWLALKGRLIKREELNKQLEEKAQLKRRLLLERLNEFFFDGKVSDLTKPLEALKKREKAQQAQSSFSVPLRPIAPNTMEAGGGTGAPPPPPPPPPPLSQKLKSTNNTTLMVVEARKEIQKSLRHLGLTVKETSLSLELLLRYKLQNEHIQPKDILDNFYKKFIAIFYQTLGVQSKKQVHKKFASKLGLETYGELIQKFVQNVDKELQSYFLDSLMVEAIDSILSSPSQVDTLTRKINTKFADITTNFLKNHFKEIFKKFNLDSDLADKNFENVELFLKRKLSKTYLNYTEEEKLDVVPGAFMILLTKIEQDPTFNFPKKISEKDNSQFVVDVEALKSILVTFLNEAITNKFEEKRPLVKTLKIVEEVKIDPSKTLPFLGGILLTKALDILPGETEEVKIRRLIDANPKQLSSLIEDVLNSLLSESYTYKAAINTDATIIFTVHTLKIFNEVITERYKGFSAALEGSCRHVITKSTDPFSLFSALLKGQLGATENAPKEHIISMSSPHDRKRKIETKETIGAFDILLSLPSLWQSKQKIEVRKQQEAEEHQKKELETMHRVQALRQFIQSEIEIS